MLLSAEKPCPLAEPFTRHQWRHHGHHGALRTMHDESNVLVADFGTAHTRLGLAHGEPRSFPSIARRASDRAGWQPIGPSEMLLQQGGEAVLSSAPSVALGEGEDEQRAQHGGGTVLVPALRRGVVTDWDAAEAVWRAAFEAVVGAAAVAAHPVLTLSPSLSLT
jgi:actin-related protein